MTHRVERHKWWTADRSRLVNTGDPDAAILAFPAGTEVAETDAVRLGLIPAVDSETADVVPVSPVADPAGKMRAARVSNKIGPRPQAKADDDEETL